ncbi:MAG: hypothetical protein AMXMBFR26_13230 [Porticoccaceae bacterium]
MDTVEPIRLVLVEDDENDALLMVDHLRQGGLEFDWGRAQDETGLKEALERGCDLVLCDHSMPGFNGVRALQIARSWDADLPLIFVSGTIGEETAVEAMRLGARDYVLKGNLTRLLPAVRRELAEVARRREQRQLEAHRQLVERERAQLAAVLDVTPDLVAIATPEGALSYLNEAGRRLLGLTLDTALPGEGLGDLFSEDLAARLLGDAFPTACRDGHWLGEMELPGRDGMDPVPLSQLVVARRDPHGEVDCLALLARDISERKRFEAELQHQATHDRLTGLPNRFLLLDRLTAELAHAARNGGVVAVMFFDLDNFKRVNDSLGHAAGDQVLQQIAGRIRSCIRPTDTVARHGGDEFTLAVGQLSRIEDVLAVLRKIRAAFELPVIAGIQEVFVTFSIGIAVFPHDGAEAETLLRNADTAMYRAKSNGRNQYRFYAPDMNERGHELLALESDLHGAIERQEFELHYQPQVRLDDGRIQAFEALLRWRHPRRGLVAPGYFLGLLEDTGLIVPVGEWVLRRACADARRWRDTAGLPLRVSVNVSPQQFADPNLLDQVKAAMADTATPSGGLEIEVTENLMMRDPPATGALLRELYAQGVRVAIDDFGIGYSSLAYLKNFPVHVLKIDRTFVNDVLDDPGAATIVEASIFLGHKLGLEVVAEGVETAAQRDFLQGLGCNLGQGYYFSRPAPATEIDTLLRRDGP